MLHRPAVWGGFAGGKLDGEVGVFLLLFPVCGSGWRPAMGRRMQASRSPAHESQSPDRSGRESAVSVPPPRPPPALAHQNLTALTPQPANTGHRSLRPRLALCGARRFRCFRRTKPEAELHITSFARLHNVCTPPPLRTTEMTCFLPRALPSRVPPR